MNPSASRNSLFDEKDSFGDDLSGAGADELGDLGVELGSGKHELCFLRAFASTALEERQVSFIADGHLLFPIGRHLWSLSLETEAMSFLCRRAQPHHAMLSQAKEGIVALSESTTSSSSHALRGSARPQISMVDTSSGRVVWKFTSAYQGSVLAVDLSHDGRQVVCSLGDLAAKRVVHEKDPALAAPDASVECKSVVTVFKRGVHKVIASKELAHRIERVTFNPEDASLVCASGEHYIRLLKINGATLEELPLVRKVVERAFYFPDHIWVDAQTLVARTDTSRLLVVRNTEVVQNTGLPKSPDFDADDETLTALELWGSVFLVGTSLGRIVVYALDKDLGMFAVTRVLNTHTGKPVKQICTYSHKSLHLLAVTVRDRGVLSLRPTDVAEWASNKDTVQEHRFVDALRPVDSVVAMAVCETRTTLVTSSMDNTVRTWEYQRSPELALQCSVAHVFNELAIAVAVHPHGMQILLGFSDHVALYHKLHDSLHKSATVHLPDPLAAGLSIEYCHGGQFFAVASGMHLYVYNSNNLTLLTSISTHSRRIRSIEWSKDDSAIGAAVQGGSVLVWDIRSAQKLQDVADPRFEYSCLAMDWGREFAMQSLKSVVADTAAMTAQPLKRLASDDDNALMDSLLGNGDLGNGSGPPLGRTVSDAQRGSVGKRVAGKAKGTIIAAADSRESYHIHLVAGDSDVMDVQSANSQFSAGGVDLSTVEVSAMALDRTRSVLVLGTTTGYLFLCQWPLKFNVASESPIIEVYARYSTHVGAVTQLRVLEEAGLVFTGGEDGHVFVMELEKASVLSRHRSKRKEKQRHGHMRKDAVTDMGGMETYTYPLQPGDYYGDTAVVMVNKHKYQEVLQRVQTHDTDLKRAAKEAESAMKATKDKYNSELRKLREDMEAVLARRGEEIEALEVSAQKHGREKKQWKQMASKQAEARAEKVREKFELLLSKQYDRFDRKAQELEDAKAAFALEKEGLLAKHQLEVAAQKKAADKVVAELNAKIKAQEVELRNQVKEYDEALRQAEEEHDLHIHRVRQAADHEIETQKQSRAMVSADYHRLELEHQATLRKVDEANIEVQTLGKRQAALQQDIIRLTKELEFCQHRLRGKEEELSKNVLELNAVRRDNQALRNFQRVLEQRISQLEDREAPAHEYLKTIAQTMKEMDEELVEKTSKEKQLLHETDVKTNKVKDLSKIIQSLRATLSRRDRKIKLLSGDVEQLVLHTTTDKWHEQILRIYNEHVAKRPLQQVQRVKSGPDKGVRALQRQKRYLQRKLVAVQSKHKSAVRRTNQQQEQSLSQNIFLIKEINLLRSEVRKLQMENQDLLGKYLSLDRQMAGRAASIPSRAQIAGKPKSAKSSPGVNLRVQPGQRNRLSSTAPNAGSVAAEDVWQAGMRGRTPPKGSWPAMRAGRVRRRPGTQGDVPRGITPQQRLRTSSPYRQARPRTMAHSHSAGALPSGYGSRPRTQGRLVKGTTRPYTAVSELSRQVKNYSSALEDTRNTVELQKLEISRLREALRAAVSLTHPPEDDMRRDDDLDIAARTLPIHLYDDMDDSSSASGDASAGQPAARGTPRGRVPHATGTSENSPPHSASAASLPVKARRGDADSQRARTGSLDSMVAPRGKGSSGKPTVVNNRWMTPSKRTDKPKRDIDQVGSELSAAASASSAAASSSGVGVLGVGRQIAGRTPTRQRTTAKTKKLSISLSQAQLPDVGAKPTDASKQMGGRTLTGVKSTSALETAKKHEPPAAAASDAT